MQGEDAAARLSHAELSRRCREQTARYRRREPYDGRYCLELLRRAIDGRDERCWQELHVIYDDQVLAWCRRAGAGLAAEPQELAALTWEKFWQNYTPAKLAAASGLTAVLRYLQMCAASVVVDYSRGRTRSVPLDAAERAEEQSAVGTEIERVDAEAFWHMIGRHLRDERERVLVYLTYELGLKPADVQAHRPDLFPTVSDVYRMNRNVLDRLRRSRDLAAWLAQETR